MVAGQVMVGDSVTAPRHALPGSLQAGSAPRGRSLARKSVVCVANPQKRLSAGPQTSEQSPSSAGFPARSSSPARHSSTGDRDVAVSATSSAQAQVRSLAYTQKG